MFVKYIFININIFVGVSKENYPIKIICLFKNSDISYYVLQESMTTYTASNKEWVPISWYSCMINVLIVRNLMDEIYCYFWFAYFLI